MTTGATRGALFDPAFNALYYSFYAAGLAEVLGRVRPSSRCPSFGHHGLAFTAGERRIFVSASDGPGLKEDALRWCEVYGKVNLDPDSVAAADRERCLAIGPSFPIRVWGPAAAIATSWIHFLLARRRIERPREHFANFWRQFRYRLPLAAYAPAESDPEYVFFLSTLWKKEPDTNRSRAAFVEVCRSLSKVVFDGGFAPRTRGDVPGFEAWTAGRRMALSEYLDKLKRSAVAFNTPAVSGCHGWKLGEYLALGKAIVSTPPRRALPAPLEHGRHWHLVDGSPASIRAAVERLTTDHAYRRHLERHARAYYLEYLTPRRVIERLLAAAEPSTR